MLPRRLARLTTVFLPLAVALTGGTLAVSALRPSLGLASEQCAEQFHGTCRAACGPTEQSEQGAFIDCAEKEKCCVPRPAEKPAAAPPMVRIDGMSFSPGVLKVKAGTEVVWSNQDGSVHTVTAQDGSFSSPSMPTGAEYRRTFTKPGTYAYGCEMHPFMSGTIVVE
jgi:plastocyanin